MGSGTRVSASAGDGPQGSDKDRSIPWLLSFPCVSIGHHCVLLADPTRRQKN